VAGLAAVPDAGDGCDGRPFDVYSFRRQDLTVVDVQLAASALATLPTASREGALAVLRA